MIINKTHDVVNTASSVCAEWCDFWEYKNNRTTHSKVLRTRGCRPCVCGVWYSPLHKTLDLCRRELWEGAANPLSKFAWVDCGVHAQYAWYGEWAK